MDLVRDFSKTESSRIGLVIFSDTIQKTIPLSSPDPDDPDNVVTSQVNALTYTDGDTDIGSAMEEAAIRN